MIFALIDIALATCSRSLPLLNMNMDGNFEATLWRHRWRHHDENTFRHNLGQSFHIWCQIAAVFNISKFSKWPPFSGRNKLFYRMLYQKLNIGYQQGSHRYFKYFEFLIDALAQILTEIYQFQNMTYSETWWLHQWRHEYAFIWI